eukprot:1158873-Pelagomonas_calceolata.AAC.3
MTPHLSTDGDREQRYLGIKHVVHVEDGSQGGQHLYQPCTDLRGTRAQCKTFLPVSVQCGESKS